MHTFQLVGGILILILVKKLFHNRNAATANGKSDAASSSSATQGDDSSSSSFPSSGCDYEVFLSFRGEDTRTNFTDHLYNALVNRGIHTFRDNEGLRIGEEIDPALRSAIHKSKIAIPIFSKNYASSKWCLRELAEIVECMKQEGQRQIIVMPVFYHVDPKDVRNQTGSYEKAFRDHQKKFGQETEGWKKALKEIGELKGWEPKNIANGHEGKLIQLIVKEVWSELRKSPLIISDNLVGIHSHVEEMKKFLNIGSDDIRIVGIRGLGGIGKTTIARCVYNTIHHHFQGCSFLADVRETFQTRGPVHLQCQLLNNILNLEIPNIASVDQGISMIKQRLSNKKVLIVVDDVDENTDLNVIIEKCGWFGIGSRIIITTRDKSILDVVGVDNIYEPNEMDSNQSLLLFSKHAFKRDQPPEQYLDLSKDVIETAGGLPLALEVLGSFLVGKGESAWKDTVKKLKKIPNHKVLGKLKISYDGLDRVEKEMFLDIACFFIEMDKDFACYMWDGCGFFPQVGIEVLHQKSLVKIDEENELRMHDQLRDLGREIVCQENPTNPGERSRLWLQPEVLDVLNTQRGTSKVGLSIDFEFSGRGECLMIEGFDSMTKLRLLQVNDARVAGNLVHSFSELRWLSWKECPRQFTPTNLRKLVVLDLSESTEITEYWMGWKYIKEAETLKVLNLSGCYNLRRTPNFSRNLYLEILILEDCSRLVTIDESLGHLKRLVSLNMYNCCSLTCFPTSICELTSLKKLDIRSTNIGRFPEKIGCLEALREFKVSSRQPEILGAEWLPNSIGNWRNLKTLSAEYCNIEEGETLDAIGSLSSLEFLSLEGNPFHRLPATVSALSLLQTLSVAECYNLQSLPRLSHLTNLEVLRLDGCRNLTEIPTTIDALTRLKSLSLYNCHALQYITVLPSGLTNLDVDQCKNLGEISAGSSNMRNLVWFHVNECPRLTKIEDLEGLYFLEELIVVGCRSLRKIPNLSHAKNLVCIKIKGCHELPEIEELKGLYFLEKLTITGCHSLRKIPKLSCSKNLVCIEIADCHELSEIEGLEEGLDSLEKLIIKGCRSLRKISKLSCLKNLVCIDIRYCHELSEIGGLGLDSLKQLIVYGCRSLRKIPNLSYSKNLVHIAIEGCHELSDIEELKGSYSLEKLIITGCHSLRKIPKLSCLKNLVCIEIRDCRELSEIEGLEEEGLDSLRKLIVHRCRSLRKIPNLSYSKNLVRVKIKGCHSLRKIPKLSNSKNLKSIEISSCFGLFEIEGLKGLDSPKKLQLHILCCSSLTKIHLPKRLSKFSIHACPKFAEIQGVDKLKNLRTLEIDGCIAMETLPCLSNLRNLRSLSVTDCKKLTEIQGVDKLESLMYLCIDGCISIEALPCLSNLRNLRNLSVTNCNKLTEIQGVDKLKSLRDLRIDGCISIEALPCLSNLRNLRNLSVTNCNKLTEIQGVDELKSLRDLRIDGSISIEALPCLSNLRNLRSLSVTDCKKLTEIQGVDKLESLMYLCIDGCISIEALPCLSNLRNLRKLSVTNCKKLTEIQGVDKLESLRDLRIDGCISIEALPCLSNLRNLRNLSVTNCNKLTEIQGVDILEAFDDSNYNESSSSSMSYSEVDINDDDSSLALDLGLEISDDDSSLIPDLELVITEDNSSLVPVLEVETTDDSPLAPDLELEITECNSSLAPNPEVETTDDDSPLAIEP